MLINYVSKYDGMGTLLLLSLTSLHPPVYASVYKEKNKEKSHFLFQQVVSLDQFFCNVIDLTMVDG